jgi:hypothetical protein
VVNRKAPYKSSSNETETDAFISSDGNVAHAVEQCALTHKPASNTSYDSGFGPCTQTSANRVQPLMRSYSFFVPAPPKPTGAGKLRYRVVSQVKGGSGSERIKVRRNGLTVTVAMKSGKRLRRYGKSFFVFWAKDKAKPTPLTITFNSLLIKQADPNPQFSDPTPPAWNLYLDVNGYWQLLNDWAPGLSSVTDGQTIRCTALSRSTSPRAMASGSRSPATSATSPATRPSSASTRTSSSRVDPTATKSTRTHCYC